jgi:hypothetical protein
VLRKLSSTLQVCTVASLHFSLSCLKLKIISVISKMLLYKHGECNVDGQSIATQRLSKHVITHATIEVRVFAARCWVTKQ